jgi:FkbM family methyltransferase
MISYIRAWNHRRIERYRAGAAPFVTPEGFKFRGPSSQNNPDWDTAERSLLAQLLPCYELFVNVGAHYGYYTVMARHLGLPVVAFEPIDANYKTLLSNLEINGYSDKVTALHAAVGPEAAIAEIRGSFFTATLRTSAGEPATGSRYDVQKTAVIPIDTVMADHEERKLFLIDVEGFEYEALKGAGKTLSHPDRNTLIVELFTAWNGTPNATFESCFSMLFDRGYEAWQIPPSSNQPLRHVEPNISQVRDSSGIGGNYLFITPAERNRLESSCRPELFSTPL